MLMLDMCIKSSKISGIGQVLWLRDFWMEGIWQYAFLFLTSFHCFSGDSSRTQKAIVGNLTQGENCEGKLGHDAENQDSQGEINHKDSQGER